MRDLASCRLIYLAPAAGTSGVGDYADDFLSAIRPHFGTVVEIRHGGPGDDGVADCVRIRRELRAALKEPGWTGTIVHSELSGGSFLPFWVTAGLRASENTATVHDPPLTVWYPYRTKLLARSWFWTHSLHFPTKRFNAWLERRIMKNRHMFVLTPPGANAAREALRNPKVHEARHILTERPDLEPAESRPLAVGMFGYAYRTKGLGQISRLRELIDDEIGFRVAGRGTENLPDVPGVDILGEVNEEAEDAFFGSIRLLVMPYGERRVYGRPVYPASGVMLRAVSYQTPVLWASNAASPLGSDIATVLPDPEHIAAEINAIVRDEERLSALARKVRSRRANDTSDEVVGPFLDLWSGE